MNINEILKNEFIKDEVIKKEDADALVEEANEKDEVLFVYLIKDKEYDANKVYNSLANSFGIEYFPIINIYSIDRNLVSSSNKTFILIKRIVPYQMKENKLIVLIDNPLKINDAINLSYFFEGVEFEYRLINFKVMDSLINYINSRSTSEEALSEFNKTTEEKKPTKKESLDDYLDGPSIQLADSLLREAINEHASDIHIEPKENEVRVRFRIDGALKEHGTLSKDVYASLLARYKIMSRLDISERRKPQDGKITLENDGRKYDFRVSTLPIIYGEKLVIRLFSSFMSNSDLSFLIEDEKDLTLINELLAAPYGIILLTGPTGSGKTTTLYSFLRKLNKESVNITTIEDPVENNIDGINQVQVNTKTGLTFSAALRSILRQDPNVIMIGEIRDSETAKIAVQSAITGHLVFSTVHTNDALTTVTRLIDMGVEPYLVADSLVGAISQRLVRRLCPHCKKEHHLTKEEAYFLDLEEGETVYEPGGCEYCNGTGYQGRIGVFEILKMSDRLKNAVSTHYDDLELLHDLALEEGEELLHQKAAKLVRDGMTSIEEFKTINNVSEIIHEKRIQEEKHNKQ